MLLLLVATLALSVPAAASIAHEADHNPGVELHFHDGNVTDDGSTDHRDQRSDSQGVGHGHPPFSATDPALLASATLPLLLFCEQLPQDWSVRELQTLTWSPHKRPPRA